MPRANREKISWTELKKKIDHLMKNGYGDEVVNACLHKHDIESKQKEKR
jgi:hypothetical protein